MRDCDCCGELPGTETLGDVLALCKPCFDSTCVEFAVDFGYITREEAELQHAEVAKMREALAEEAA